MSNFFHAHAHSQYSALDGLSIVPQMVKKAVQHKQPALAITDHGNMAYFVKLYKECKKAGIKAYPGLEGYLMDPRREDWENPAKGAGVIDRYHLGLLALNEEGYKALVKFTSMTHTRPRYNRFPRFSLQDLAELGTQHGDDLVITTGCYFGYVIQTLVNEGYEMAKRVVKMYASWFPHTFVELQNHNIVHPDGTTDLNIVHQLLSIAEELDLPVIATQDSHYLDQDHKQAHSLMKRMTYGGEDDSFPGDYFHLASTEWVQEHYTDEMWEEIEEGFELLLSLHDLSIEPLDNFAVDVPSVKGVKSPSLYLKRRVHKALEAYLANIPVSKHKGYRERTDHEMGVIGDLSMQAYFVIWIIFVEWCRDEKIAIEARGSANGSLVLFLIGVTQVDPIKWDVDFERFLTRDRIKPPDVDMDIEDSERPRAIQFLISLFGGVQIGTYQKLGATLDEETGEERGNVMTTWKAWARKECEKLATKRWEDGKLANKGAIKPYAQGIFNRTFKGIDSLEDVRMRYPQHYVGLKQLADMKSAYRSYGVHAGGVLLPGKRIKIEDYIPTMLVASSNTRVTQYDMDDVEEFGLLKMDILGQATLRVMKIAQESMGESDPTDFSGIPEDDKGAFKLLREGKTDTGIFHFEGYTKAKGGRELGVKSVNDSILVHALYMPGPMDVPPGHSMSAKDHYIRARKDRDFRNSVTYPGDVFEKNLAPTYGAFVFQNQVLQILRDLGMDVVTVNAFLKIVKDSGAGAVERNYERSEAVYQQYLELARKAGVDDPEDLWGQLVTFAKYGFNKAHAAGYGIRSYRCAYLKSTHTLEFMHALLVTWAGRKKEKLYIREARRQGLRILPPHVNVSTDTWAIDYERGAIRKGLVSIEGVGVAKAIEIADAAPYASVTELVESLPPRVITGGKMFLDNGHYSGTLAKLRDAGALDDLPESK